MARETWLNRLRTQISHKLHTKLTLKKTNLGIISFEIASLMSKLIHLNQLLTDKSILHLKNHSITLEGVRKLVSNDESFLLALACAEMLNTLNLISKSVSWLSQNKCDDSNLKEFRDVFTDFTETGRDPYNWVLSGVELEAMVKKVDRYVTSTSVLFREMEELVSLENGLKKALHHKEGGSGGGGAKNSSTKDQTNVMEIQQKVQWQKQEVKYMKEKSLWNRSFDGVVFMLAKLIFTTLARIKLVFGIGHGFIATLPRSLSTSSAIYPSIDHHSNNHHQNIEEDEDEDEENKIYMYSGPIKRPSSKHRHNSDFFNHRSHRRSHEHDSHNTTTTNNTNTTTTTNKSLKISNFLESNTKVLKPPTTTLGANGLALHYANLIIVLEKMVKSPQLVGLDARDDLYSMLPNSIRSSLRGRLRGIGFSASDPVLAGEWRDALTRILGWLGPLAHNMIKWQSERSIEQQNGTGGGSHGGLGGSVIVKHNLLLLQTLFFANKDKTEAAITELLVGLNYIWRFEREMNAKALFECCNLFNLQQQQQPPLQLQLQQQQQQNCYYF